MSYEENSPEAEAGRRGEQAAITFFKARGWGVFNMNDGRSLAPMLARAAEYGDLIMPDIQVYVPQAGMRFVEVKWKEAAPIYQRTGTQRHGIDLPNWLHYLKIRETYEIQIALAIVELKRFREPSCPIEPRLLVQGVQRLSSNLAEPYPGPKTKDFPYGSAFWERDVFKDLGPLDGLDVRKRPTTRLNLRPWERAAKDGSMPKLRKRRVIQIPLPLDFNRPA